MDLDELRELLRKGYNGRQLTSLLTDRTDSLLSEIFSSIDSSSGLCLMAVGGYGRGELSPHSDIDIMLFARDRSSSERASEVLYKLWDTKLTIGHSFRTAADCISEARKDVRTRTSLLEHRYIAGDEGLYRYFLHAVYPEIAFREPRRFIVEKLREVEQRHRKISDSVFMLEPHVKEGRGCLRDIHTMIWLAGVKLRMRSFDDLAAVLTKEDFRKLNRAYSFILKVRFCLHLLGGRRNDVLSFEFHDAIAEMLQFRASKGFLSSERFMRYFYLKTSIINDVTSRTLDMFSSPPRDPEGGRESRIAHFFYAKKAITDHFSLSRNCIVANNGDLRARPERIIEAFYCMSNTGKRFSPRLKAEIRKSRLHINRASRRSHHAVEFFMKIVRGDRAYETLREMHNSGVLGRFVPEFGGLSFLVVYEPYHRYTVDEHTLHAIRKLEELRNTKYRNLEHLSAVLKKVRLKEVLILALLLHDIGKKGIARSFRYGAGGGHHDEAGYRELKIVIERFNLSLDMRSMIEFLVKNHLLMSTVAFKTELDDPEVIARFADEVGDRENLDALYLLTYADMASVSPDFWSEWKAYLLKELYETTSRYLEGSGDRSSERLRRLSDMVHLSEEEIEGIRRFLSFMPERYAISTIPERVCEDYRLHSGVLKKGFGMGLREEGGGTAEICVGAWDRPGIFSRIVGVLSSLRMNIYRSRIYTGKDGVILDKIQISNWKELFWEGMFETLEERMRKAICADEGGEDDERVLHYIRESQAYTGMPSEAFGRFGAFIELDNESSAESSILEFFAQDRIGLLYDVTSLMHRKDIDIISARINTESGIAHDIFSIQQKGKKVEGRMVHELLLSLWERLQ